MAILQTPLTNLSSCVSSTLSKLHTGLAKRVGHWLRECLQSLRSNWRNNGRGGVLSLSLYHCRAVPYFISSISLALAVRRKTAIPICVSVCVGLSACCMLVSWNKDHCRRRHRKRCDRLMMTWTLKRPNQPKHYAVHAVVLWLRQTKRRAGKPECRRRNRILFLSA